jgi:uncharacterized membrane protein YcaP (DUF421 family)
MLIALIRTFILYAAIVFAVRLMGKRQLSQMQTTELVGMLLISDLAAVPMQDTALPLLGGLVPITVLVFCEIGSSLLFLYCPKVRQVLCGRPVVVICRGKVQQKAMRDLRLSVEELFELLRQKDVKNVEEVDFAIVETNGLLSVLRKEAEDAATPRQLHLQVKENGPAMVVIDDGQWRDRSLALCGKDRRWGENVLKKENLTVRQVFLMTADAAGHTHIVRKERYR